MTRARRGTKHKVPENRGLSKAKCAETCGLSPSFRVSQSWNGYAYGRNNPLMLVDPDGLAYRVCQVDENGKETNCTTTQNELSDVQFGEFQQANKNTLTFTGGNAGNVYQNGTLVGTFQQTSADADAAGLRAVIQGTQQADVLIKDAAKQMAVGAAMTATGVMALRGLGYAAEAAAELGVFKNTKVVINFVGHAITDVRPGHLPPPGTIAEIQQAVEGAIQTGNYVMKAGGVVEGTTQIQGVAVGFGGRIVNGVARIGTVFRIR